MSRFFKKWIKLHEIPPYAALLTSVILGILSVFSFVFRPAEGVILFLLGLIAASFLIEQKREEKFRSKVLFIADNRINAGEYLRNLGDLPSVEERMSDALEFWMSGLTLSSFLVSNRLAINRFLENKGKIRLLIAPETGMVADIAHDYLPAERNRYKSAINLSMDILREMKQKYQGLEVKQLKVFPAHYLWLINPDEQNGEAQIHLNLYRQHPDSAPVMIVHREESPEKFSSFRSEFIQLWNGARDINLY